MHPGLHLAVRAEQLQVTALDMDERGCPLGIGARLPRDVRGLDGLDEVSVYGVDGFVRERWQPVRGHGSGE